MKLIQIPFSHNCLKVRIALGLKGLPFDIEDIPPADRAAVVHASGQGRVPVLVDGYRAIADSTSILLYLEERHPDRPLLPTNDADRNECLILEDWIDRAFMAPARRIAYVNVFARPGALRSLFLPGQSGPTLWLKERIVRRRVTRRFGIDPSRHRHDLEEVKRAAELAVARLDRQLWLFEGGPTIADVALAAMTAPLRLDPVRHDAHVAQLLEWGKTLLAADPAPPAPPDGPVERPR